METIFYDVDTQNDFMHRDGALFVSALETATEPAYGAECIIGNLRSLTEYAKGHGIRIMGSVDRHFSDDPELNRNGGPFPDHCMDGARGQQMISETTLDAVYVENKTGAGMGVHAYSSSELEAILASGKPIIFEKQHYDVFTNPNAERVLVGVDRAVVYGVATDYCVLAAVKGMRARGIEVYVVADAIKEVNVNFSGAADLDNGKKAILQMQELGAKLISTADVLESRF